MVDKKDYDNEPVCFCRSCLSLNIRAIPEVSGQFYCDDCGDTDLMEDSIEDWKKFYREKYGKDFIQKAEKPKNTFI